MESTCKKILRQGDRKGQECGNKVRIKGRDFCYKHNPRKLEKDRDALKTIYRGPKTYICYIDGVKYMKKLCYSQACQLRCDGYVLEEYITSSTM